MCTRTLYHMIKSLVELMKTTISYALNSNNVSWREWVPLKYQNISHTS